MTLFLSVPALREGFTNAETAFSHEGAYDNDA